MFLRRPLGPVEVGSGGQGETTARERTGVFAKSLRDSPAILEVILIFPLDLEPAGPEDGR